MISPADAAGTARALITARGDPPLFAAVLAEVAELDEADLKAVGAAWADLAATLIVLLAGRYRLDPAEARAVVFAGHALKAEMVERSQAPSFAEQRFLST